MPIGIIINACAIIIGGIIGTVFSGSLSSTLKENLNLVFGLCSMGMAITSIILMENMPAVILSVIVGTVIGLSFHIGDLINKAAAGAQRSVAHIFPNRSSLPEDEFTTLFVTVIVLVCASTTGIYGTIVSSITGDHSLLIAKAILDFFTALIFAGTLGAVVPMLAIPQLIIFMALYVLAGIIYPLTTPTMINDFKAAGGIILLATGFRVSKIKIFPTADMIPAMVIVMPISWFWVTYILPLVS